MSSNPESREQEIFLWALERQELGEQLAFVEHACGSDHALCERIQERLRRHHDGRQFGETLTTESQVPAAGDSEIESLLAKLKPEEAGERIGAYKLVEQIGEGGFGTVWMAEQERPVRRRVALKIIKVGMDTRQVIARFEQERQALAMMDHPNIAKVFDAGATPFGRPYFAMELVTGVPITEFADQERLTTKQRLELFVHVCQAVQHAHQKGIIHRDLKPSNVLVTVNDGVPVPKVIDFGVAKAIQQPLTDLTLFTAHEQMVGTPLYMSPEQAEMSSLDIDTRSDIYALGVLLYELLTGRTPLDPEEFRKHGYDEMRRAIREEEPPRPSVTLKTMPSPMLTRIAGVRQSDSPRLVHAVEGDLDWIVMKALEKDRGRRYETANGLAGDIQRHLNNEPVLARPPTRIYRLQKLYRRNRGTFMAGIIIAASLVAGIGISLWQALRATEAEEYAVARQKDEEIMRARAERESAAARLNEYVADIALAAQSFADGNYRRGVQLLEKHRPTVGETDLRGFEWRYLWQRSKGDEHFAIPDQGSPVQSLAFSPDGDLLAIGLHDKLNVWNVRANSLRTSVAGSGRDSPPRGAGPERGPMFRPRGGWVGAFFQNGRSLVVANSSGAHAWSTESWMEEKRLPEFNAPIAISGDGALLAATKRDRQRQDSVAIWETQSWKELRTIPGARSPFAFAPGGKLVATTTDQGITLQPVDEGSQPVILQDSVNAGARQGPGFLAGTIAFAPNGKVVAAARNTPSERGVFVVTIWDAASGAELATLPSQPQHIEHTGVITALAFSPDGRTLATASLDHSVRLWDFAKRERIATMHGHLTEVWALAFAPDGQVLASGGKDGEVKLWTLQREPKTDALASASMPLGIAKDGKTLIALAGNDSVGIFDTATGEIRRRIAIEPMRSRFPVMGLTTSADGRWLVQSQADGTVKIWNTETGEARSLKVSDGPILMLALSPDGGALITAGREQSARWWNVATGESSPWPGEAMRVQFSPDGQTIAALQRDSTVQFWDVATRTLRATVSSDSEFGGAGAFSPDGRRYAAPGPDDTILLWDAWTGESLGTFSGHKQPVFSVAFSPDGKTLASSSDDSTVRFWNVATRQELLAERRLGGSLSNLLFSPDGSLLVGSGRGAGRPGAVQTYRAPLFTETDRVSRSLEISDNSGEGGR